MRVSSLDSKLEEALRAGRSKAEQMRKPANKALERSGRYENERTDNVKDVGLSVPMLVSELYGC